MELFPSEMVEYRNWTFRNVGGFIVVSGLQSEAVRLAIFYRLNYNRVFE